MMMLYCWINIDPASSTGHFQVATKIMRFADILLIFLVLPDFVINLLHLPRSFVNFGWISYQVNK